MSDRFWTDNKFVTASDLHPDPEIAAEVAAEIRANHAHECRYCRPSSGYSERIPSSVSPLYVHMRGPDGSPSRVVCNASDGVPLGAQKDWAPHVE